MTESRTFQGKIPVSTAKQVFRAQRLGRKDFIKQAVVDKALQIRQEETFPVKQNSVILFGGFPEEASVKGLVHDATVNLYSKEMGFRTLGKNPTEEEILELLEGSITGSKEATDNLKHSISDLETGYDLKTPEILEYTFDNGSTLQEMLETVAGYRVRNWTDQTEGFRKVLPEENLFGKGMSGRIDLLYQGEDQGNQITELKITEEPSVYDEFQVSAYWLMNGDEDAGAVIDYPLTGERLEFNTKGKNDFDPRNYVFEVDRARDTAIDVIEELRDLQSEYFKIYDSREKATREALRDMEV